MRSQGQGIALAQEFLDVMRPSADAGAASAGAGRLNAKWMLLAGACGLACAAPLILGAAGLGVAGIGFGTVGVELGVVGLVAVGIAAYVYYRKRNQCC